MREPIPGKGHFVVVVRKAPAQKAQDVLVDEIEVPEAVHISWGGVIADGMSLVGVCEAAENVPRSRDGKEKQHAGDRFQFAPATPLAAQHQQRDGGCGEEDRSDQTLGEGREGQGSPHSVDAGGTPALDADDEAPKSVKQEEAEERLGDSKAGEEKWPNRSQHA